jgi:Mg2+ and Co2+ transporter CorA
MTDRENIEWIIDRIATMVKQMEAMQEVLSAMTSWMAAQREAKP